MLNLVLLSVRRFRALLFTLSLVAAGSLAAAEARISFDIPAGQARETLKEFARQAGREIVFPSLDAIQTNAVKGELTVREAIDQLLADTPLAVFEDAQTGGMVIRRREVPNGRRVARETGDHPSPSLKTKSDRGDRDTLMLSPFVVTTERDAGWSANETLTASRTRQALKDVPVNIDAVTSDFMEDLGLFSADETAQFIANVYAEPAMATEGEIQTNSFAFRGLRQNGNVSRNYFEYDTPSDTYNVERIDFGKGSNSLVFGATEPGGQASVFTKRPLMSNFGTIYAAMNSEGGYRYQVDLNRKLREGLAIRFNAVRKEDRTFQDASVYKFGGETVAMSWQPFPTTTIRLEKEWGRYENTRGYAGLTVREQSARSLSFQGVATFYTSDGNWIVSSSLPAADRSGTNAPAGGSLSLMEGEYVDVQMRNAAGAVVGTRRVTGLPKEYNLRGSFDNLARPFNAHTLTIEQRVGPVSLELAYNRQNQPSHSRNDGRFSSTISLDVNGRPYIDAVPDHKIFSRIRDSYRLTAVYNWEPFTWMKQVLVAGAEYNARDVSSYTTRYYNLDRFEAGQVSAVTAADHIRFRLYLDDPEFYSRALFDQFQMDRLQASSGAKIAQLALPGAGGPGVTQWEEGRATLVSASGSYFKGRLQSLLGVRWDWNRTYEYTGSYVDATYGELLPAPRRQDSKKDYTENPELHLFNTSYTAGLTYALTRNINLYALYSNSYKFQGIRTYDSKRFGPIQGVTTEIGLKGSALNDRIGFTLGVFNIDRENVVYRWLPATFTADDIENLMNPNHLQPGDPGYVTSQHGMNQDTVVMATESSRGADLTLMARPFKGLQARLTIGHAKVESRPDFSSFRAFYDAAVARGDESPALIADAKEVLDSNDVATTAIGGRGAPWSVSWILDYSFARESWRPLRGVRIGINGSWRDSYLFGIGNGQELFGGTTHPVNAYIMRDQKIWGQQVRIRASVKNLIDLENNDTVKNGFTTLANGTTAYRYGYVMPAQYELSASIKF